MPTLPQLPRSVPRAGALLLLLLMAIALCWLAVPSDEEPSKPAALAVLDAVSARVENPQPPPYDAARVREQALLELGQAADYLRICGKLNLGFEGCAPAFSEELRHSYEPQFTALHGGFALSLTSIGRQASEDRCSELRLYSSGDFESLDNLGNPIAGCDFPAPGERLAQRHLGDGIKGNEAQ